MADENTKAGKGTPFFDRADQLVGTGNWDYAIEMYIQGLSREPEQIERGLNKLREASLARKANGGKGAGFLEKLKHKASKDPIENLSSALWHVSRDPVNPNVWKQLMLAAKLGEWKDMLKWASDILFDINRTSGKPSEEIYIFITDMCEEQELYGQAVRACQMALQAKPTNSQLDDRLRNLSAKETIQKGKYDQGGSFTESVKDLKSQIDLNQKDQLVQSGDYLQRQIAQTQAEYEENPDQPSKVSAYVDALLKFEDESYENQAIDVLKKLYKETGTYRYKMRMGDILIRQMSRRRSNLIEAGEKEAAKQVAVELLKFELGEYAERAENYPTDLKYKYELGKRYFVLNKFDEAISALQQARRDPKHRMTAMSLLGQAFYRKGWHSEAADTFRNALKSTEMTENRRKELTYFYGMVLEAQEKPAEALEQYSEVAQLDFNYRDVRVRIERLRGKADGH